MRLTNSVKEAVIKHILQDLPQFQYRDKAEAMLRDLLKKAMPAEVLAFANSEQGHRLESGHYSLSRPRRSLSLWVKGLKGEDSKKLKQTDLDKVHALLDKHDALTKERDDLEAQLTLAFAAVNTRKQAVDAFPEFARYLPEEPEKLANLPIPTGVVTDLVNAGWKPKKVKP